MFVSQYQSLKESPALMTICFLKSFLMFPTGDTIFCGNAGSGGRDNPPTTLNASIEVAIS